MMLNYTLKNEWFTIFMLSKLPVYHTSSHELIVFEFQPRPIIISISRVGLDGVIQLTNIEKDIETRLQELDSMHFLSFLY